MVGELRPMPHGGALRNGGPNRGGSGRPPKLIRLQSRDLYGQIIDEIRSRDLTKAKLTELAVLANTMGRYGLGTVDALREIDTSLFDQLDVRTLSDQELERLASGRVSSRHRIEDSAGEPTRGG